MDGVRVLPITPNFPPVHLYMFNKMKHFSSISLPVIARNMFCFYEISRWLPDPWLRKILPENGDISQFVFASVANVHAYIQPFTGIHVES